MRLERSRIIEAGSDSCGIMRSPEEQEFYLERGRFGEGGPDNCDLGALDRVFSSAFGLAAGDAAMVFLVPVFPSVFGGFAIYTFFSVVGWVLIGLPFAIFVPSGPLCRLSLPQRIFIGAGLGPMALFLILVLLAAARRGDMPGLGVTGYFWLVSALISTIAFLVYTALLRRRVGRE